jgi:hypothetical protein
VLPYLLLPAITGQQVLAVDSAETLMLLVTAAAGGFC